MEYVPYTANGFARHSAARTHSNHRRSWFSLPADALKPVFFPGKNSVYRQNNLSDCTWNHTTNDSQYEGNTPQARSNLRDVCKYCRRNMDSRCLLFRVRPSAGNYLRGYCVYGNLICAYTYLQTGNVAKSSRRTPLVGNRRCRLRCWDMDLLCIYGRQFFRGRSTHYCRAFCRMGS